MGPVAAKLGRWVPACGRAALALCLLGACEELHESLTTADPEPAPELAARPDEPNEPDARTRMLLLGSGTPEPDPARSGPSVAVLVDDAVYLFDAGPGVVRRAAEAGLAMESLERVFLTHLHSDHTLGLPDLMLSPWVVGRERPLEVRGPPGTEAMVARLLEAWREDIEVRTQGLEAAGDGWQTRAVDVTPGVVHQDARVTVRAFAVEHGSWEHAYGYRVEGPDRVVVISGDTGPTDAVVEACDGCDVLVHEVYREGGFSELSDGARAYHGAFHTSSSELAALATRARPTTLVLYHHLLWGGTAGALLREVRAGWSGEVRFGRDLERY